MLKILRDPAAIDENGLLFAATIKVSVERGDHIDAFLSVSNLLDLSLCVVIKDSTDLNRFHGPSFLKLLDVAILLTPDELALVWWSDVDWLLGE